MSTPQMPSHMPQNPMYNQQQQQQLQQTPQKNTLDQTRAMYQMRLQQQQQQLQLQQQQQQFAQQHLQQQHAQTTPVKQMTPMHHQQQPMMNRFSTPQPPSAQPHHPLGPQGHVRNSLSRSVEATPLQNGSAYPLPSPASGTKVGNSMSLPSPHADEFLNKTLPDEYPPKIKARDPDVYGGIDMRTLYELGEELITLKPDFPTLAEMGTIDVHALTMSLQSGLHAEVRLALDSLVVLSMEYERLPLELRQCDDLVESLIDCAEIQVELLAENAAEVSDVMLITSYEDVVRSCYVDKDALRDIPAFGTLEYILDRAVDKLICIMSILRNLSFHEQNQPLLSEEFVIKFICVVIRYLGTRNMLLRTNQNTLDFMKDGIVLLSNLAHEIKLPGREQALCLLHFLIAFAPCPPPNCSGSDKITFSPYDPTIHYYLYPAIDSLAKLLARDEPNRTHYKTIFASDVASSPPFDLLTRTFALSISAIPDQQREIKRGNFLPLVEARKPMLMQGLLAAEILSNLAPGYDSGVAKAWLTSEDGFAKNLSTLILSLCNDPPQTPQHRATAVPKSLEEEAMLQIVLDGISVLRILAEKSRDPDDPTSMIPIPGLPATERIIKLLERKQPRLRVALRQLCAFTNFCS
ncbi:hypothetical protein CJF30_00007066 [Rutstroemia sp. NJR-2017a BBW]|nr:hypothetical protein CJF30_00007066 [Rutstroemia sp. NJR-2017a BBW]